MEWVLYTDQETVTLEDALAFTGKIYYWIRWQPSIEGTQGSLGFNLCALLFGICWCFYRKLYVVGLILIAVESVVVLSLSVSLGIFLVLIGVVTAEAPLGTSHTTLSGVLVGVVAFLLVYLPFGLFANRLLFNRARKEIGKIDASGISGEARNAIIKARGGVSIPGLILGIILSMAVNFAMK